MELIRIDKESGIPLIGCIAFGIIDRRTNLLQIRPTTVCNLNCVYCSTDSGAYSQRHNVNYVVDKDWLIEWIKEVVKYKGENDIEANMDSVGEVLTHPNIVEIIKEIKKIEQVKKISMQTNGSLLDANMLRKLEKAGLNHINLSINAIDCDIARAMSGIPAYNVNKILDCAKEIVKSGIELMITPVWVPGLNDNEMPKIIAFAKEIGAKLGVQKYEVHKFGRKPKKAKEVNYWKFYNQLSKWEKEFNVKLKLGPRDFEIHKAKSVPILFEKWDKISVDLKCHGWMKGQMIGISKNRCITLHNCAAEKGNVRAKIIENANNIYTAEVL